MDNTPIYVFAKWRVKEGQLDTVLSTLKLVASKSTAEKGNILYKAYQSTTDPNTILLYEVYEDEQAVADHRDSEHFQTLVIGQIVPLLEHREITLTTALPGL